MEFLNIEINETIFKRCIIGIIIFIIVYMACSYSSIFFFKTYTLGANTSVNDEEIVTHIDSLTISGTKVEITGYAYKENEEIEIVNCNYVIKNQDTGKMYLMKTQMEQKDELEDIDCNEGGMHAQCLTFGLPKGNYQIFVLYQNNDEDILADTLIPFTI